MVREATLLRKAFLAVVTLIRFLFGVNPRVFLKITFPSKGFLTLLTLIWFLVGMSSDVYRQVT